MKLSLALCAALLGATLVPAPAQAAPTSPVAETVTPLDQRGPDLDDHSKDPAYQQFFTQEVKWGGVACPTDRPSLATMECAQVMAPKDWHDVNKGTLLVGLSRPKGTAETPRKQRLLLANPGGPGSSGLTYSRSKATQLNLMSTHLPVGVDPRGVGMSTPLRCPISFDPPSTTPRPHDPRTWTAEELTYTLGNIRSAQLQCHDDASSPYQYLTTEHTARDFDLVRHLLGYRVADYYGASYGTKLGSVIAKLFPRRFERVLLDGNTAWNETAAQRGLKSTMPYHQQAVDTVFIPWLARRHSTYGLGATPREVERTLTTLIDAASAGKLGKGYHPMDVMGAMVNAVRTPGGFAFPGAARKLANWHSALQNGSAMPENPQPMPSGPIVDNSGAVNRAVNCNDGGYISMSDTVGGVLATRSTYPLSGADPFAGCPDWPHAPALTDAVVSRPAWGILMTQNEGDPATPYPGALNSLRSVTPTGQARMLLGEDAHGHCSAEEGTPGFRAVGHAFFTDGAFPTIPFLQGAPLPEENVIYEFGNPASSENPHPEPVPYSTRRFEQPLVDQAATAAWQQAHPGVPQRAAKSNDISMHAFRPWS